MTAPILVLALGNPLLHDEGVGASALERLCRRELPNSVELLDGGTAGLSLVPRFRQAERVLVLDAVRAGAEPGTILRLEGTALPAEVFGITSPHQLGLSDILRAVRLAGGPREVVVLGVEPLTTEPGIGLSAPVSAAVEKLVDCAFLELRRWSVATKGERCTS
ncbi:MAG TPA: HyaD/HybD family hydrogenase maturation endopeptidase [Vicinamibacteria bacterium]|nr:HyaD/HybD family hydrogenase maturation endopeptidase [Vicinamibacteria bacterium]